MKRHLAHLIQTFFITIFFVAQANAFGSKESSKHLLFPKTKQSLEERFASWGVAASNTKSSINIQNAWKKFKRKKDVVVAIIDTGIDPVHPYFKGSLYIPAEVKKKGGFGLDFSHKSKNLHRPLDSHGHGTHVAGIVKSVFPQAKLFVLKYYNPEASGRDNLNSTIEALRYVVENHPEVDIINYSGGGPEPSLEELKILKMAERKGILVVAAAGNEESNIDLKKNAYYPASYRLSNIITVNAHNQNLTILPSSNYGKSSVDISAPGNRIKAALPQNRAGYLTGTSQATAFVSGVAGLLKSQFPQLNSVQIKRIIKQSAKKENTMAFKNITSGRLDAANAIEFAIKFTQKSAKARPVVAFNQKEQNLGKSHSSKRNVANSKTKKVTPGKIIYRVKESI